jgi:hypothetical protein
MSVPAANIWHFICIPLIKPGNIFSLEFQQEIKINFMNEIPYMESATDLKVVHQTFDSIRGV